MIRLRKEQVILLHERLIEATGGSNGIRDGGMLDSALANPFQSFGGKCTGKSSTALLKSITRYLGTLFLRITAVPCSSTTRVTFEKF